MTVLPLVAPPDTTLSLRNYCINGVFTPFLLHEPLRMVDIEWTVCVKLAVSCHRIRLPAVPHLLHNATNPQLIMSSSGDSVLIWTLASYSHSDINDPVGDLISTLE